MNKYRVTIEMECESSIKKLKEWVLDAIEDNLNLYGEAPEERVMMIHVETIEE